MTVAPNRSARHDGRRIGTPASHQLPISGTCLAPLILMTRKDTQNNVNQNGKREHEHPHGQSLPHDPQTSTPRRDNVKREGKAGQRNFIPGEAPVGEPGRTKPFNTRRK
jgi:hypothetical protein